MGFISSLKTLFTPDSAVTLVADWFLDKADRQRIDAQLLALQELATYSARGQLTTQVLLSTTSSADGALGDCVCAATIAATESDPLTAVRQVLRADAVRIAAAGIVLGILVSPTAIGAYGRVALEGIVGPSVTGLAAGAAGPVRLNLSTRRCERVASYSSGDYPIGYVDAAGNLTLARGLRIP